MTYCNNSEIDMTANLCTNTLLITSMSKYLQQFKHFVEVELKPHEFIMKCLEKIKKIKKKELVMILFDVRNGNLELIKNAHKMGLFKLSNEIELIDMNNSEEINEANASFAMLIMVATAAGHLDIIEWLCNDGNNLTLGEYKDIQRIAAEFGHFKILQWKNEHFQSQWIDMKSELCAYAAKGNQIEIIKWICSENITTYDECKSNRKVCSLAAKGGHLELLKWLREQGFIWDRMILLTSALKGRLEILKWIWDNEFSYDAYVAHNANDPYCEYEFTNFEQCGGY